MSREQAELIRRQCVDIIELCAEAGRRARDGRFQRDRRAREISSRIDEVLVGVSDILGEIMGVLNDE